MSYQIVIIDQVMNNFDHPVVQKLFPKIVKMKVECFQSKFDNRFLPFDTNDWIGTHLVICKKDEHNELNPIFALKVISSDVSNFYRKEFTGKYCASSSDIHHKVLEDYLSDKENVGYISSYAIASSIHLREKYDLFKISFSLSCAFVESMNIKHSIILAAVATKANSIFKKLGLVPFSDYGNELPSIFLKDYGDAECEMLSLCDPVQSFSAKTFMKNDLWKSRIEIFHKNEALQLAS